MLIESGTPSRHESPIAILQYKGEHSEYFRIFERFMAGEPNVHLIDENATVGNDFERFLRQDFRRHNLELFYPYFDPNPLLHGELMINRKRLSNLRPQDWLRLRRMGHPLFEIANRFLSKGIDRLHISLNELGGMKMIFFAGSRSTEFDFDQRGGRHHLINPWILLGRIAVGALKTLKLSIWSATIPGRLKDFLKKLEGLEDLAFHGSLETAFEIFNDFSGAVRNALHIDIVYRDGQRAQC